MDRFAWAFYIQAVHSSSNRVPCSTLEHYQSSFGIRKSVSDSNSYLHLGVEVRLGLHTRIDLTVPLGNTSLDQIHSGSSDSTFPGLDIVLSSWSDIRFAHRWYTESRRWNLHGFPPGAALLFILCARRTRSRSFYRQAERGDGHLRNFHGHRVNGLVAHCHRSEQFHLVLVHVRSLSAGLSNLEVLILVARMLGLWTVSSYVFGHAAFDQMKIPKRCVRIFVPQPSA